MNLRERAKQLGNNLPLMENREKGELDSILDKPVTIIDYGFMLDDKNKEYVAFVIKEDEHNFYFGGQVLTEGLKELDADGCGKEIKKDGLPILLETKRSNNNRNYTKVTYYPPSK